MKKIKNLLNLFHKFHNKDGDLKKDLIKNLNKKLCNLDKPLNEISWLDKLVSNYTRSLNLKRF